MNIRLILNLTRQDFRDRYAGSILGIFWALINPLVMITIYLMIFSEIMGAKLPGTSNLDSFSIYLISGLLPWLAFSNTIVRTTSVFQDKKNIITKVKVNLKSFPIYIALSESLTFFVSIVVFLIIYFLFLNGKFTLILILPMFFLFFLQQSLAVALGLIFALANVFFKDTKEFVSIFSNLWFWLTPIVWVPTIAPVWLQKAQESFNPAYWFISGYREMFLFGAVPEFANLVSLMICFVILFVFGITLINILEKDLRDFI